MGLGILPDLKQVPRASLAKDLTYKELSHFGLITSSSRLTLYYLFYSLRATNFVLLFSPICSTNSKNSIAEIQVVPHKLS